MGFCHPRLQAGLCKTLTALPLPAAPRPRSGCLSLPEGQKSRLGRGEFVPTFQAYNGPLGWLGASAADDSYGPSAIKCIAAASAGRRGRSARAEAVPGVEPPQVGPPGLLALVVEGHDEVVLPATPAGVDVSGVGRGGRAGEAVVGVLAVRLAGELPRPQLPPVAAAQADEDALARLLLAAGDEEPSAVHDRRGVAGARQLHLPGVALPGPARREALHLAEAGAVGPPEARPVLGRGRQQAARPREERF